MSQRRHVVFRIRDHRVHAADQFVAIPCDRREAHKIRATTLRVQGRLVSGGRVCVHAPAGVRIIS